MTENAVKIVKEAIKKLRQENVNELSKQDGDANAVSENRRIIRLLYLEVMEDEFTKEESDTRNKKQPIGYKPQQ